MLFVVENKQTNKQPITRQRFAAKKSNCHNGKESVAPSYGHENLQKISISLIIKILKESPNLPSNWVT